MRALGLALLIPALAHAETCRFVGTTSHDGHLAATVTTSEAADLLTVDVAVTFAISALSADIRFSGQEISTWRAGALQSLAMNQRTVVDGSIKRQQWDVFQRHGAGLEAYRLQAKRLVDFRQRYPAFAEHWPSASFARPWLQDFAGAGPDRRPDLDLPATATTQAPLALAFYWSRFLPDTPAATPLVLPGFKRDKSVTLRFDQPLQGDGWRRWSAPLAHPDLEATPASLAAAWVSPQHYLMQLGFEIHTSWASGTAILRADGCQGVQLRP